MIVRFRAEAAGDVIAARAWSQVPSAFPEIAAGHRRALLRNFPYALYYRLQADTIDVVACLHTRRSQDRWTRNR